MNDLSNKIIVYLDTSVIAAHILEHDTTIIKFFNLLKNKNVESYVSLLTLTEISNLASISEDIKDKVENIENLFESYDIKIHTNYPDNLVSGSVRLKINNLSYSDILHLQIASSLKANYLITIDFELLNKNRYDDMKIIRPIDFIEISSDVL